TGRGEIIGKLADKAVAYYDGLPAELMTPQTRLYRGMALVRKASSLADGGNEPEARKYAAQARAIFVEMRAAGNQTDEVATALALAMFADPSLGGLGDSRLKLEQATGLLRPIVKAGHASRSTKLALADMLQFLAHTETAEEGLASCEESRKLLTEVGALDQSDLTAASIYGDVTDTQSRMALKLGRLDEAERLAGIVSDVSEKVLEQRPSDLRAMRNRYYSANVLGRVSRYRHDLANAEKYYAKGTEATLTYVRFNPADSTAWSNLTTGLNDEAFNLADQGRYSSAVAKLRTSAALEHDPRNKTGLNFFIFIAWKNILLIESRLGHEPAAREAVAEISRIRPELRNAYNLDAEVMGISDIEIASVEFDLLATKGDFAGIHSQVGKFRDQLGKVKQVGAGNQNYRADMERRFMIWQVESALRVANFEEAVSVARDFVAAPRVGGLEKLPLEFVTMAMKTRLAQGLLATGRRADGVAMLREVVAHFRAEKAKGAAETDFRQEFSRALYQLALAQSADDAGRAERTALLDEADAVLTSLSLEAKQLAASKDLIQWVNAARAQSTQ
ncbi:MAG: hypothetical protein JWM35_1137, partial [Verrucomicrobia bacterium]|nr:hypothetical protein [Verrucomicrobiota bacterium]